MQTDMNEQEARQAFEEGSRLFDSDKYDDALRAFKRAIAFKPGWAEAWQHLAWAQGSLQETKQALKSCEKALRLKGDYAAAWIFRGMLLEKLERYQEAVESYDHGLKHRPDDIPASGNRIETLSKLEQWVRERLPPKLHLDAYELVTWVEERLHMFIRQ